MKKRIVALLLSLGLLSSLPTPVLAAEFTDLEDHWAAPYLNELADLGYLTGYADGTVKPDRIVTACEAIALLTRLYNPSEDVSARIHEDYGTFVATYVDPTLSWAYDELELCLATGILSQNELKNLRLTSAIDKELLSVLFVRALQLNDEAEALNDSGVVLTFKDTTDITRDYRGHIAILLDNKIVNGNDDNEFLPHSQVSRAVMATMLVRSLEYLEAQNQTLWIEEYDGTAVEGMMLDYSGGRLVLRDQMGFQRTYSIPAEAEIVTSTGDKLLSSSQAGSRVRLQMRDGNIVRVTVYNLTGTTVQQAVVKNYSVTNNNRFLQIIDVKTKETSTLILPQTTKVSFTDGTTGTAASIGSGMFLTLIKNKSGSVTDVTASSATRTVDGVISSVTFGSTVNVYITDDDGSTVQISMELDSLPQLLWGSTSISVDRLAVGMEVTVTVVGNDLQKIVAKDTTQTVRGTLTTVLATSSGTTWTILDDTGINHTMTLSPSVTIYHNGQLVMASTVQAGDLVSVKAVGDTILSVDLLTSNGDSSRKLTGTVLSVDTRHGQLTVLNNTSQRLVYVDVDSSVTILNAATGRGLRLSDLKVDQVLTIYGSYTDVSDFDAVTILIEG